MATPIYPSDEDLRAESNEWTIHLPLRRLLGEKEKSAPSSIACGTFGPNGEWACWLIDRETYEELAIRKGWVKTGD